MENKPTYKELEKAFYLICYSNAGNYTTVEEVQKYWLESAREELAETKKTNRPNCDDRDCETCFFKEVCSYTKEKDNG